MINLVMYGGVCVCECVCVHTCVCVCVCMHVYIHTELCSVHAYGRPKIV